MSPWLRTTRLLLHKGSNMVVQMCLCTGLMKFHQRSSCVSFQECVKRAFQVLFFGCISHLLLYLFYFSLNRSSSMKMFN